MHLIDTVSQLLRCEVALYFINTWDINDLTLDYYWKQLKLRVCVTYVPRMCLFGYLCTWLSRSLLAALHNHRIEIAYGAFPERVGLRISLEKEINSVVKKKKNHLNEQNFEVYRKTRIEDRGSRIEDRGSGIGDRGLRIEDRLKKLKMK